MNNEKVSIVTPFYNTEKFLERCINSVIRQTHENLELILVDDGSTDNSYFIAERYSKKDNRIILLKQTNQGQSIARNYAFSFASGDYIAFLDSDDYWNLNKIKEQLNFIKKNDVEGCFVNFRVIKEKTIIDVKANMNNSHIVTFSEIAISNCIVGSCSSLIAKKKCFDGLLFEPNRYMEDYHLWFELINNGAKLIFLNKYLAYVDDTHESSMNNLHKMFFDYFFIFKKQLPLILDKINDNNILKKVINKKLNNSLVFSIDYRYKMFFYLIKSFLILFLLFNRGFLLWKPKVLSK